MFEVWRFESDRYSSQFGNDYFTEMCSGSEKSSYSRSTDVYHSSLDLRVIKKREKKVEGWGVGCGA